MILYLNVCKTAHFEYQKIVLIKRCILIILFIIVNLHYARSISMVNWMAIVNNR